MSNFFTRGELTAFKRGGWRGLAQGATTMAKTAPEERRRVGVEWGPSSDRGGCLGCNLPVGQVAAIRLGTTEVRVCATCADLVIQGLAEGGAMVRLQRRR